MQLAFINVSIIQQRYSIKKRDIIGLLGVDALQALTYIGQKSNFQTAMDYSEYDKEWLVLPAMPKLFNFSQVEYSATLDSRCISNVKKYEIDKYQYEKYYILI